VSDSPDAGNKKGPVSVGPVVQRQILRGPQSLKLAGGQVHQGRDNSKQY